MTTEPTAPSAPTADQASSGADQRIHLARWTCTTGSSSRSRGAVVLESGDHRWQASADGNGAVDALFRAVDEALHDVLTGHPRLIGFDVKAMTEGADAEGLVTVKLAPPAAAEGARSGGTYEGTSTNTNIIAAAIEAYISAINDLLAEEHWQGATDSAGNFRAARGEQAPHTEYDPTEAKPDTTRWWT
jgi:2-isopropylmalate synthase